jgi:hypothetical protein
MKEEKTKGGDLLSPFFRKYTENGLFLCNQNFCFIAYIFSTCLERGYSSVPLANRKETAFEQ